MTPERVAALLGGLRQAQAGHVHSPNPHLGEILLWIAAGIDNRTDLAARTGLSQFALKRCLQKLLGRGVRRRGRIAHSPLALLQERPHPDRRGTQLQLTAEAQGLIASTFEPLSTHLQGNAHPATGVD